ncbi:MAG: hypothetical protein PHV39_00705 [Methanomicrobium sp.]|nr:hypothetical protein [Methanomicrobium sp.]
MTEKIVYGGALVSGGSLIISGLLIAFTIMAQNAGEALGDVIFILPFMAVILVAGVAAIIYGSREEETNN